MVEGVVGSSWFDLYGADLRQYAVTVVAVVGVAFRVMDRVAEDVFGESDRERDQVNEALGGFGADGVGDSIG